MKQLLTLFISLLFLEANAQQLPTYSINDLESGNYTDVLFNRKKINPAIFSDSSIISADFLKSATWIGPTSSPGGMVFLL
jgi:hypothetical protein